MAGAQITYVGDLANAQWLSVVDASQNSNNPCVAGASAASAAGTGYSGAQRAGTGTKLVTIPQSTLLDDSNTYTVCYAAYGDGSSTDTTWRDSYVRFKISKMESLSAHSVTHKTDGQIAHLTG